MTTRRAVTYGGLFCLLVAWLASAASTVQQPASIEPERRLAGPSPDALIEDVQAQSARLRERLAVAPVPQAPHRNPFAFEARPQPRPPAARRIEPVVMPEPLPGPPEPALSLMGIAEDQGAKGLTRTAIIGDGADGMLMVTVGQTILNRYRVEAIGTEAVELRDLTTDTVRRLALR
jgi:hypothetical protein